ncbi:hypothetical protein [Actinomadura chokoriensis]|uniref:Uncharacterized protein n=1 Tax=Actinomadura chokoriensis TaxID=454156 RepID=A0ABV4QTV7_9ACTN
MTPAAALTTSGGLLVAAGSIAAWTPSGDGTLDAGAAVLAFGTASALRNGRALASRAVPSS